jgi:hypothetical protein
VRRYDPVAVEAIRTAHLSRRPAPVSAGNGGALPNGASRKAGLTTRLHDAGWGRLPRDPRVYGSRGRHARGGGPRPPPRRTVAAAGRASSTR